METNLELSNMEEVKSDGRPRKKDPYDRANIVSGLLFCWLCPFFKRGFKKELTEDDMYLPRNNHDSRQLGDLLEMAWKNETVRRSSPSLLRVLLSTFSIELILYGLCTFVAECLRIIQPALISRLMSLYQTVEIKNRWNEIYLNALFVMVASFAYIIVNHFYNLKMAEVGLKMRVACCSLMYRKTLKLNKRVLVETTVGKMLNLLSNDVGRFDVAFNHINQCWLGPVLTCIVIYLTCSSFGWMGMSGMIVLIGCIPLQMFLGKKISEFRLNTAVRTDERVRLMNEIINGIQVIKMYTWEKPFAKLVEIARMKEIRFIRFTSYIRGFLMSMSLSNNRVSIAVAIIVYVSTGNPLTSTYVYTITSYYRILTSFIMFFPHAISQVSELKTSICRLQTYLLLEENKKSEINRGFAENFITKSEWESKQNVGIEFHNVSAKWVTSHTENNLKNVTMNISSPGLVAIVGSVGSGKSSFLQVILQELEPIEGYVIVNGSISYASQEPWLFGSTIRQNILFGQPYDKKKYDEVIKVCALISDLNILPYGDKTRVGERGVTLSGGQRARVNLARAVYKEADIYLLDDPLSAVDANVGKHLFEECICKYLANKCVVLVTHQLQFLKYINRVFLLEDGNISATTYCSDNRIAKFVNKLETKKEDATIINEEEKKNNVDKPREDEAPQLKKEGKEVGNVTYYVYNNYIKAAGHVCKLIILLSGFVISQSLDSMAEYFVTIWVNIVQWKSQTVFLNSTISQQNYSTDAPVIEIPYGANRHQWMLDVFAGNETMYIYASLTILLLIVTYSRSTYFYTWCLASSVTLHNKMFDNIIHSPMEFFNTNPSGRILNRFSKDIGVIDELMPLSIFDTLQIGLTVLSICLIMGTLTPWAIIPTAFVLVIFYIMRVVYLETSRDVKRIESIARSPIYSHLTASLQGLTTVRAFQAQELLAIEFDKLQNSHSAAFFMYLGAQRSFGFWLDFFCILYVGFVLVALLIVKGETFGGNVGLALTQAMTLTGMFQWGIRQWSELENQMTSVERIQEYTELSHEVEGDVEDPPSDWPRYGQIEFNKVYLRYSKNLPVTLRNISMVINSEEKVGVVGRTGAGKSSLIQALFRLAFTEGSILIDGIDTSTVPLNKLRSKISIIPQEPVLFNGTLRENLDPFNDYSDKVLWSALEEVELKSLVSEYPEGLDSKIAEGGGNFSVGQRQLLCLARAIVRQNKILILDEATANVDLKTDGLIQTTIRRKFSACTVLTVAHRLHSIIDSDKVLVMDAGEILEYDSPHLLLQNQNGVFYSLVMKTGVTTATNLIAAAETAYKLRHTT
ncbi:probable multidrug resistance-associated protein lethal(2)03659 isoform X2 [Diorhabda sublineata]|uniref:probable multidrug resistance-associated protein lethal(2)03659 isoform X1 n=3 Tax=Diorhabda sublineata TaxID=1163346 RepID=UPI0024E19667|nr:probable multidrug resistance-associated protein lethal(2)03659 isoform X1 [Diorhabda sublineata]XP_056631846.1 probable multidrug resistance-associated protein lethal(2)03659 isoform X2 [Diorhabda sublineata]